MFYKRILQFNTKRKEILTDLLISKQDNYNIFSDYGLYFRSIKGTLNHILFADCLWLMRLSNLDKINITNPKLAIDYKDISKYWTDDFTEVIFESHFKNIDFLISHKQRQKEIDKLIYEYLMQKTAEDFENKVTYLDTQGIPREKILSDCVFHLVNHSTHHIGQITSIFKKEDVPNLDYTNIMINQ